MLIFIILRYTSYQAFLLAMILHNFVLELKHDGYDFCVFKQHLDVSFHQLNLLPGSHICGICVLPGCDK